MINPNTGKLGRDLKGILPSPSVVAITDQAGFRAPIKTLTEGLYLKIVNGQVVCSPAEGGGIEDHRFLSHRSDVNQHPASAISTVVTNFNKNLSIADTDVQKALDTIDNFELYHVKATDSDITHGALIDEVEAGANVTIDVHTTAGKPRVRIAAANAPEDTYRVRVNNLDTFPDFLANKLTAGNGLYTTVYGSGALGLKYDVLFHEGPMTPVGQDWPGILNFVARGDHSHPVLAPAVAGSYLYTARIKDPLDKGQVVCCFIAVSGCIGAIFSGWTQIYPGVMERNDAGPLIPTVLDGVDIGYDTYGVESWLVGRMVMAFDSRSTTDADKILMGPYIVEDVGWHWEPVVGQPGVFSRVITKARMRRASGFTRSEDFVQGMTFQVQTGNTYGTDFITLQTADPVLGTTPLDWAVTEGPTYNWNYGHSLLSSAQLVTENVDPITEELTTIASTSNPQNPATSYLYYQWMTKPGTPGATILAAGHQEFHFESVSINTSDLTGTTYLIARLMVVSSNGTTIITEFDPMPQGLLTPNRPGIPITIPYELTSDIALTTIQRFNLAIGIVTTCSSPVTLTVRTNSATHGTYWKGTFELPANGGTNDHQALVNRFPDVGKGEEPAHNMDGLGAGFLHTPFPNIVTLDTGGWLPKPLRNELLIANDPSNWLQGIEYTDKFGGDRLYLTFINGIRLYHNAAVTSKPGYAPLYLTFSGATPQDLNWLTPSPRPNSRAIFQLRTDANITPHPCWQLIAFTPGPLTA